MRTPLPAGPSDRLFGLRLAGRLKHTPLEFLTEVGRTYGDLAYMRLGPVAFYLVNHPDLIRTVLVTQAKQFRKVERTLRGLRQIDGNGLVLSEGDFWLRQRRLMQPIFHPRRLAGYAAVMVETTRRRLAQWPAHGEMDVAAEMTELTLEIICRTLFGIEPAAEAPRLREAVATISETVVREVSSLIQWPDWLPLPDKVRKRRAIRTLDTFIRNLIRERRASGADRGDLLSLLLQVVDEEGDGTGMTDEQARDEAMTLFNAGHDSSAAGLAWVWHLIATHPDVEARLVAEVERELGDRPATFDDVPRLRYAEQVVKETLRLYPPTWALIPREAVAEVELGGYRLPRGAWAYIFPWVTHRDGRFFPEPEKFDPDRFAPGRVEQILPYSWIPFGAGPHLCIGNTFATVEMVLVVTTVLQQFRLMPAPGQGSVEPEPHIAIRPRGGLRLAVTRRVPAPGHSAA